jgi:MFS family permease
LAVEEGAGSGRAEAPVSQAYANYVLGVLFLVYVFNFIDRQILAILIGPIKQDLGVSDTAMGFLAGFAFAVFYTFAGIPIARLADRGSRRTVITLGLALWSAMTAASGLARSFVQLALARVLVGVGEAAGSPPAHSLISDYFPPERRATALALYANGIYVGAGIAFLAGGYIVTHFDWRVAFVAVGLAGLPLALLVGFTVRELPRGASEPEAPQTGVLPFREVLRFLASRRTFVWLAVAACCQALSGYGLLNWGPEYLSRVHAMPRAEIGRWLGLAVLVGGCGGASLGGWLADRLGRIDLRWHMRMPAVVCVLGLPLAVGFLLAPDARVALLCFGPFYAISNMYLGPMLSTTQGLVPVDMRATASAVLLFLLNIVGAGAGPFLVGFLNDRLHPMFGVEAIRYSMLLAVAVGGLASVFFWRASGSVRAELREARAAT